MLTCRCVCAIATQHLYSRLSFNFPSGMRKYLDPESSNPYSDFRKMLSLHPERALLAASASFRYSRDRPDVWDHMANILPKLSSLHKLEIRAGLSHPDPFGEDFHWAVSGGATFDEGRNLNRLFEQCDNLHTLHTIVVLESKIRLQEAWAIFQLPSIPIADLKILHGISLPANYTNDEKRPHTLSTLFELRLTSNMVPEQKLFTESFRSFKSLRNYISQLNMGLGLNLWLKQAHGLFPTLLKSSETQYLSVNSHSCD
jgi:hypothetical protein